MTTKFTTHQIGQARIMATQMGGLIGGSFVVDPDNANDIDIFVGASAFNLFAERRGYRGYCDHFVHNGIEFDDSFSSGREYYESNNEDDALVTTLRSTCGTYNVIVVQDDFVLAFKMALMRMTAAPEKFKTKAERVSLHHQLRAIIRTFLSDSFAIHPVMGINYDPEA